MFKKVNIKPQGPIFTLRVPITAPMVGIQMSVGDIASCLHARALVTEVLPTGKLVKLDLSNYNKDNSVKAEAVAVEPKVEIMNKVDAETSTKATEPVITSKTKVTEGAKIEEPTTIETSVIGEKEVEPVVTGAEEVKTQDADPKYFEEVKNQQQRVKGNKNR